MATDMVAIVTGGAEGIGKTAAAVLLKLGYKVSIWDMNEELGTKTATEFTSQFGSGSCVFYKCDVTDTQQLKECFNRTEEILGKVNMVVNNAGILNERKWGKMVDINLNAYIDLTYLAVGKMRKDKGGNGGIIVNLASMSGFVPWAGFPVYATTKWAVLGFTKSMQASMDLAPDWGISLLALCPSFVQTSLVKNAEMDLSAAMCEHGPQEPCQENTRKMIEREGKISLEDLGTALERLVKDNKKGSVMVVRNVQGTTVSRYMQQTWSPVQE